MANLIIKENGVERTIPASHGEEITIQTPCDCSQVTGVKIANDIFPFYDACGNKLSGVDDLFAANNLIRVLIDTVNTRATILNQGVTLKNLGIRSGTDEPADGESGKIYFRTGGDAVVEVGTSGIWTYRKWASGIAECWGSKNLNLAITTPSGNGYYVKFDSAENYPFTFAGVPQQFVTLQSGDYAAWIEINAASSPSTTDTGVQMLVSTIERESGDYTVAYHVIGRWK